MTDQPEGLYPDDVVRFTILPEDQNAIDDIFNSLSINNTFAIQDFAYKLCAKQTHLIQKAVELLVKEGMPSSVLTSRHLGWRSGKVKLSFQFIPDEPEPEMKSLPPAVLEISSPLNEIRKQLEDYSNFRSNPPQKSYLKGSK